MNNYMLLIMAAFLIVFMMWSSRSRRQQMQKLEQEKRDQLAAVTPGEWVRTRVGFWGRFVDHRRTRDVLGARIHRRDRWPAAAR